MSHVLERVGLSEFGKVLVDCRRILVPGGQLIISVPDLDKVMAEQPFEMAMAHMFGGQTHKDDFHKCGFRYEWLEQTLEQIAFDDVKRIQPFADDCSTNPISMTVEATKRSDFEIKKDPEVILCYSYPRVGFTRNFEGMMSVVAKTGWRHISYTGPFWDRDLTIAMKEAVKKGADYVLTVDYDTVFTEEDVMTLFDFMQNKPEIGACFAPQMSRWSDKMLVHDRRKSYFDNYTEVDAAHFGLTMIRTDMLKQVPQPWLWGIPDEHGEWDENYGRLDADMNFWIRCRKKGFRLAQVNSVCVGHLEQCVKWGAPDGKVSYQPINNYRANGKPKGVGVPTATGGSDGDNVLDSDPG